MIKKIGSGVLFWLMCYINPLFAQTVAAPHLTCANVLINSGGAVQLVWTLPNVSCGPFISYDIYSSQNYNGPYTLLASITNPLQTTYSDGSINGTTDTAYYFIVSNYNCPGSTFLHSDTIDNLDPLPPVINYVTVSNGQSVLSWQPSPSPETYGYILYHYISPTNQVPIDTVYGWQTTSWTDILQNPNVTSIAYTIAALDSCGNTGTIYNLPHNTIYVTHQLNRCGHSIKLDWTNYINWPAIAQYDVYVTVNGGARQLLQTFTTPTQTYTWSGFNDGDNLCFSIVVRKGLSTDTSESNHDCFVADAVQPVNDFYIRNVTVTTSNAIQIFYSMDSLSDAKEIHVGRGTDGINFTNIDIIPAPANRAIVNSYTDATAVPNDVSYYYQFTAFDSCNNTYTSNVGQSILLTGYAFTNFNNLLNWSDHHLQYGMPLFYNIYREDASGNFLFDATTNSTTKTFQELVDQIVDQGGTLCYRVESVDENTFPNGLMDTVHAFSNVLCLSELVKIYMPNAFTPTMTDNNVFMPVMQFTDNKSYSFTVFNRYGQEIFSTTDFTQGWNGTYDGKIVEQGVYAYYITVVDGQGRITEKKGTVLLLK